MSAPAVSRGRQAALDFERDARRRVRSALAHAAGSCMVLVSVVSAAWSLWLADLGLSGWRLVLGTVVAGVVTAVSVLPLFCDERCTGALFGLNSMFAAAIAVVGGHVLAAVAVAVSAVTVLVLISRLSMARLDYGHICEDIGNRPRAEA